jgi:fluoroquinolone transport system permease protein
MRLTACIRNDIRIQFRSGFYLAYAVVTGLYVVLLRLLPWDIADWVAPLVIFTDPSVVGLFFVGGLILLEKNDHTLESLFVTPVRTREYIWSKAISLGLIAVLSSLVIALAWRGWSLSFLPLLLGVGLTSFLFTMLGIAIASDADTVNRYMLEAIPYMLPFYLPLLWYFEVFSTFWFQVIPTTGSLNLIAGAFEGIGLSEVLISTGILVGWCLPAYGWALRSFARRTGKQGEPLLRTEAP